MKYLQSLQAADPAPSLGIEASLTAALLLFYSVLSCSSMSLSKQQTWPAQVALPHIQQARWMKARNIPREHGMPAKCALMYMLNGPDACYNLLLNLDGSSECLSALF